MLEFREIADDVHVARCTTLDVNSVLVPGGERALLVDTLSTPAQAAELAAAVRRVTPLPVLVLNTHDHFDHWFGNHTIAETLGVTEFWAHEDAFAAAGDAARSEARRVCAELAPEIAEEVAAAPILKPNHLFRTEAVIDLGGRTVRVWHPGPAHSQGDVVAFTGPVTIAGDLVEEGAPPSVGGDADTAGWVRALTALLPLATGPVVPGHGAVVDAAFVERQRDELAATL